MNIGIFVELYRPHTSGVVTSVDTLVAGLRKKGHRVFIFAPDVPSFKDKPTNKVIRLPSFAGWGQRFAFPPLLTPKFSNSLLKKVKDLKLDLIHVHGPYPTGMIGAYLAKKLDIPLIMTYHTHLIAYLKSWTKWWWLPLSLLVQFLVRLFVKKFSDSCQIVITPGNRMAEVLRSYGVKKEITVIPNAVHFQKTNLKQPSSSPVLVYTGRIAEEKNLLMLIKAFSNVLSKEPKAKLFLVGGGSWESKIAKIIRKKGLSSSIILTGVVPHEKIPDYLSRASVFVFPSVTETQSVSIVEAMAAGLPTVVTNEGGARENVEDGKTGFIVKNDPKVFSQAVIRLLENEKLRRQMGKNGKERVKMLNLTSEAMVNKILKVYQKVLNLDRFK